MGIFLGNKGLCGEPLSFSCGTNGSDHETYHHKVSYRVIFVGMR